MLKQLFSLSIASFASLSVVSAARANVADVPLVTSGSSTVIPGRFIVEFDTSAHLSGITKRGVSAHETLYDHLRARGLRFDIHAEYDSELFVGASITLSSTDDLSSLAGAAGVINITPVHALSLPDVIASDSVSWTSPAAQNVLVANDSGSVNSTVSSNSTASANSTGSANATATAGGSSNSTSTASVSSSANSTSSGNGTFTGPISTPQTFQGTTGFSNLPQIQAQRVQATGNKGKGVKIGVIDGGVDYTLPVLGGCFGAGCKVAGGYDFVGDSYDGSNTPVPDNDPFDNCYSHGTFTTGIIAAGDNVYNVTGVAPDASIYQYRVFGCNGATSDDIVVQAMLRAFSDGVDIINLSLGDISGWTEGTLSVVASRLVKKGLIVVSSAGNRGQAGAWYTGTPAAGLGVINVGAVDNANIPAQQLYTSTGYGPITYYNFQPFTMSPYMALTPGVGYPITAYTTDPTIGNDGCTLGTNNLSNRIVIVRRGGCSLSDKAQYAYRQGAIGILVVNTPNTAPIEQEFPLINFGMIDNAGGNYLLNQIAAGNNITLSFGFFPIAVPNTYTGNTTSYFSSIGPTNDLYFAPSITAPGQNIIGVVPNNPNAYFFNWTIADGTSWSSAFAAGAAALYLNAKGTNASSKQVKEAMEFSSVALPFSRSDSSLASVAVQGSGKLQIFDAINSNLVVSPTELTLNDTAYFNSIQYITLKNTGRSTVKYQLKNVPAGTALTFATSGVFAGQPNEQPVPQTSAPASVRLSQSSVTLWPGFSTTVVLQFTAPTGLDPNQFPVYSGWIEITGAGNPVHVPYMGVAAAMKNMPIIDESSFFFGMNTPVIQNGQRQTQSGSETYTFQNGDYPTVLYRRTGGTPILVIDLVDANANLGFTPNYTTKRDSIPVFEERAMSSKLALASRGWGGYGSGNGNSNSQGGNALLNFWCQITWNKGYGCSSNNGGNSNTFAKVPIVGHLLESDYIPRSSDGADSQGNTYSTFALTTPAFLNGTTIPNGSYRFLLRALKITGDSRKEADYESWLSMPITIAA